MYYPYVLKELRFRFNRTLVNVFGIAVGIALFVSISAVSAAYKDAARQPFKNIGADLIVQLPNDKRQYPNIPAKIIQVGTVINPIPFFKVLRSPVIFNEFENNSHIIHA